MAPRPHVVAVAWISLAAARSRIGQVSNRRAFRSAHHSVSAERQGGLAQTDVRGNTGRDRDVRRSLRSVEPLSNDSDGLEFAARRPQHVLPRRSVTISAALVLCEAGFHPRSDGDVRCRSAIGTGGTAEDGPLYTSAALGSRPLLRADADCSRPDVLRVSADASAGDPDGARHAPAGSAFPEDCESHRGLRMGRRLRGGGSVPRSVTTMSASPPQRPPVPPAAPATWSL